MSVILGIPMWVGIAVFVAGLVMALTHRRITEKRKSLAVLHKLLCPQACDDRRMKITKGKPVAICIAFTTPGTGLVHTPLTCLGTSDSFKCQECLDWCDGSIKVTDK